MEIIAGKGQEIPTSCLACIARVRGSEGNYCDPPRLGDSQPLFCFRKVKKETGNLSPFTLLRKKLLK